MIKSMTGFGRSEQVSEQREVTVEIKSVNHRFFDFSCRTSRGYNFLEEKVKSYIQQYVSRGKVDVYVGVSQKETSDVQIRINHSVAAGYVNAMKEMADTYGIENDLTACTISRYPDVLSIHKPLEDEDEVWNSVKPVLNDALESFLKMREREGKVMCDDIKTRSDIILSLVEKVEKRSPETVKEYKAKLEERIKELLDNAVVDEQRLLTEAAIFADKVAVDEETVRLKCHFTQMEKTMNSSNGAVGRKLDFIVQEMNREANTIGSKAQDSELAHVVVEIKSELEKIREQVQNIE